MLINTRNVGYVTCLDQTLLLDLEAHFNYHSSRLDVDDLVYSMRVFYDPTEHMRSRNSLVLERCLC